MTTLPQNGTGDGIDNNTTQSNQPSLISVRQNLPGGGEAEFDTPIDSSVDDFTVSVSGPDVNLTILNPNSRSAMMHSNLKV